MRCMSTSGRAVLSESLSPDGEDVCSSSDERCPEWRVRGSQHGAQQKVQRQTPLFQWFVLMKMMIFSLYFSGLQCSCLKTTVLKTWPSTLLLQNRPPRKRSFHRTSNALTSSVVKFSLLNIHPACVTGTFHNRQCLFRFWAEDADWCCSSKRERADTSRLHVTTHTAGNTRDCRLRAGSCLLPVCVK